MLITRTLSTAAGVVTSSVDVKLNELESQFAAAYGEPKVDRAGVFAYVPEYTEVPQLDLSAFSDLGAPPVAGSLASVSGLPQRSYQLQASGALAVDGLTNQGSFANAPEVIGDFEFVACLGMTALEAAQSFIGIAMFTAAGDDAPGVLFGWGNLGTKRITLRQRATVGGALLEVATTSLADPTGLSFRVIRSGNTVTTAWSLNGTTWNTLGSVTVSTQSIQVGLFGASGTAALVASVFQGLSLSNTLSEDASHFTIAGSPDLHFIRTDAPHKFSLVLAVEPEAKAKCKAWGEQMTSRLSLAKDSLLTNPNPTDTTTVVEG